MFSLENHHCGLLRLRLLGEAVLQFKLALCRWQKDMPIEADLSIFGQSDVFAWKSPLWATEAETSETEAPVGGRLAVLVGVMPMAITPANRGWLVFLVNQTFSLENHHCGLLRLRLRLPGRRQKGRPIEAGSNTHYMLYSSWSSPRFEGWGWK